MYFSFFFLLILLLSYFGIALFTGEWSPMEWTPREFLWWWIGSSILAIITAMFFIQYGLTFKRKRKKKLARFITVYCSNFEKGPERVELEFKTEDKQIIIVCTRGEFRAFQDFIGFMDQDGVGFRGGAHVIEAAP